MGVARLLPSTTTDAKPHEQSNWLLEAALRAFLQDEFPALHPEIRSFIAERDTEAAWPIWRVPGTDGAATGFLADVIAAPDARPDPDLADEALREDVGVALRDRRLIASQRASKPFIFQSGGLLKTTVEAWTVREIVAYMDRHPADGIYHLCNGTLEQWLRDEGAPHLAWLAHEAVLRGKNDRRRALEIFLLGTGQVPRPRLLIRPKRLDMGYVLGGSSVSDAVRLRRGRGRGYLFGTLATSVSWLDLVPKDFGDNAADLVVTADTSPLLIRSQPHQASVLVTSSAAAEPVSVPVQFRVVAMPSRFNRLVLYPLMGLLVAGLLGAVIGWLFTRASMLLAPELPAFGAILRRDAFWIVPLAVIWGILGAMRGFLQPPAWPDSLCHSTMVALHAQMGDRAGLRGLACRLGLGQKSRHRWRQRVLFDGGLVRRGRRGSAFDHRRDPDGQGDAQSGSADQAQAGILLGGTVGGRRVPVRGIAVRPAVVGAGSRRPGSTRYAEGSRELGRKHLGTVGSGRRYFG